MYKNMVLSTQTNGPLPHLSQTSRFQPSKPSLEFTPFCGRLNAKTIISQAKQQVEVLPGKLGSLHNKILHQKRYTNASIPALFAKSPVHRNRVSPHFEASLKHNLHKPFKVYTMDNESLKRNAQEAILSRKQTSKSHIKFRLEDIKSKNNLIQEYKSTFGVIIPPKEIAVILR